MKRIAILFITLLATVGSVFATGKSGTGTTTEHTLKHKGVEYTYYLYRPQNLKAEAPLVVVFHGYRSRQIPSVGYGLQPLADREGFAICYPRGPKDSYGNHCWKVGYKALIAELEKRDDVGFVTRLVKKLQSEYGYSRHNTFALGNSNGGALCYIIAATAPDTFAAYASVSGHIMEVTYRALNAKKPVPFMEVHGTADPLARWNGDPYNNDNRGADIAIPLAVGYMASVNHCTHELTDTLPLKKNRVIAHRYVGGDNGTEVWLYEVVGGKHNWGNDSMNTKEEIWKFFAKYLR